MPKLNASAAGIEISYHLVSETSCMLLHLLLGLLLGLSYVGVIKIAEPAQLQGLDRNNRKVLGHRLRRVSWLCAAVMAFLPIALLRDGTYSTYSEAIRQFGVIPGFTKSRSWKIDVVNVAVVFLKMALLFCGPLANLVITSADIGVEVRDLYDNIWGFRDNVFAPVSEEFIYRGAIVAVLQPYISPNLLLYGLPLLFGVAHMHHGIRLYFTGEQNLVTSILITVFQLSYTFAFGILANYFYLTTLCNLWCPIVAHVICNVFGFPSFSSRHTHPRWFYVYCGLLVVGLSGFLRVL